MEWIANIDRKKYAAVFPAIRSETVILTDNQKEHIIKRRGKEFFDRYRPFFREIVEDPDYIFSDKSHEHTVIASKTVAMDGKWINLVIRLAVESDKEGIENSVITAIAENDKRYRQRLRNNPALYKKE